jgi:hypothetical protein
MTELDPTTFGHEGGALAESAGLVDRFPENEQEAEKIEELLENEFNNLSLIEKDQILFDIHGIAQINDEDPPSIAQYLQQMEEELGKIRKKVAYEQAKYVNEAYVTAPAFRLMFLRSDRFDAKLAAKRLVLHFNCKQKVFGSGEVLGREIRLSDMNEDDMESLESGFLQVLPTRDAAGRSIICIAPMYMKHKKVENLVREEKETFC